MLVHCTRYGKPIPEVGTNLEIRLLLADISEMTQLLGRNIKPTSGPSDQMASELIEVLGAFKDALKPLVAPLIPVDH